MKDSQALMILLHLEHTSQILRSSVFGVVLHSASPPFISFAMGSVRLTLSVYIRDFVRFESRCCSS